MSLPLLLVALSMPFIVAKQTPILLLPGFGGSLLQLGDTVIYPPQLNEIVFNRASWISKMRILFDPNANKYEYNREIKTLPFGDRGALELKTDIPFFDKKNIYGPLLRDHCSILPIPYDFRLIHIPEYIDTFYADLTDYIERLDSSPVSIISHSSGGLLLHYFLTRKTAHWKSRYVKEVVYVNVPFCGLTMPLLEITQNTYTNRLLSRDLMKSFGGIIINLPNQQYLKPVLLVDGIETDYIAHYKLDAIGEILKNNGDFLGSFDLDNGVKTTIVYTSTKRTPAIVNVYMGGGGNKKTTVLDENGDGIVLLKSIMHPINWNHNNIKYIHIPQYEHSNILHSVEFRDIIENL